MQDVSMAPQVINGFVQPSFPFAKVFTFFFFSDSLVIAKTGSGSLNTAGIMKASLGGFTAAAMVAGAVGEVVDQNKATKQADAAGELVEQLTSDTPASIVAAHKLNFQLPYDLIKEVKIKGPNFAGELSFCITADKQHKFRMDKQSKESARIVIDAFEQYVPGKVTR